MRDLSRLIDRVFICVEYLLRSLSCLYRTLSFSLRLFYAVVFEACTLFSSLFGDVLELKTFFVLSRSTLLFYACLGFFLSSLSGDLLLTRFFSLGESIGDSKSILDF